MPGDAPPVPASLPDDDAPGLVTVGAVEPRVRHGRGRDLDAGRHPAPYSLTGAWVDVYAPGGPVSALHDVPGRAEPVVVVGDPDPFTGTSFAAPVVTGTAALVRQVLPRATAPQVRRILLGTSSPPPYPVVDPRRAVDEALALRDALWARPPRIRSTRSPGSWTSGTGSGSRPRGRCRPRWTCRSVGNGAATTGSRWCCRHWWLPVCARARSDGPGPR